MTERKVNNSNHRHGAKPLIYVVDDEPMLLELAVVILEPLGYAIRTFRDPQVALEAFTGSQPQPVLIIADYAMHPMNGLGLLEACRQIRPTQKVLLVSGTVDETICHHAVAKPDRFLSKPFQAKQLVDLVKALLVA